MQTDLLSIGLGFLEGFALIVSPCILPILPIILAGSLTGSKKRPLGIVIGFVVSFSLFTFFSRKLVQYSGIDLNLIRHISYVILFFLGVAMFSTYLTEKFSGLVRTFANVGSNWKSVNDPQGGMLSGILFGGLIALIWTPCAGPILAAVIVQTVIQETSLLSFLILIAFSMGVALPMLIIAFFGRSILEKFHYIKTHTTLFRKLLGVIIIFSVGYMVYFETGINVARAEKNNNHAVAHLQNGLLYPYAAPAIAGITAWINSSPLTLNQLKGKVVLVDFWTYSCINCIRTLPYLKDWYQKYHEQGFVIIGVHAPEFDFEKNLDNVKNAVLRYGITYPVALDNNFITWRNFSNQYWPAHYLIDKKGNVVYTHFGEGEYDVTEDNIRYLLGIAGSAVPTLVNDVRFSFLETPETYLGYARAASFTSPEPVKNNQFSHYTFPKKLNLSQWALQGNWQIMSDKIISGEGASAIRIHFNARKVFVVMGSPNKTIHVKLLLNGKDISNHGVDVSKHMLYEAVVLDHADEGILEIMPSSSGLEVYTFTFGE